MAHPPSASRSACGRHRPSTSSRRTGQARLAAVIGRSSPDNSAEHRRRSARASASRGIIGLPTFNRGTAEHQYLFVNGRPVKDRLLLGAVRAAYGDLLPRDRHPVAALFLDVPPRMSTSTSTRPRPRSASAIRPVRGLIVGGSGARSSAVGQRDALDDPGRGGPRPDEPLRRVRAVAARRLGLASVACRTAGPRRLAGRRLSPSFEPARRCARRHAQPPAAAGARPSARRGAGAGARDLYRRRRPRTAWSSSTSMPRTSGWSRADAARAASATGVARQVLLIPEVVELDEADCDRLDGARRRSRRARPGARALRRRARCWCARRRRCSARRRRRASSRDLADELAEWDQALGLERQARPCRRDDGLPRLGPRRPPPAAGRDERAAARDGGDAALRPVQPWPADLCRAQARRHRACSGRE